MIGYGLAFVIGWVFVTVVRVACRKNTYPWSLAPIIWGLVFVGLNWLASL